MHIRTRLIDSIAPIDIKKLRLAISNQIMIEKELLEAFIELHPDQKEIVKNFLKVL